MKTLILTLVFILTVSHLSNAKHPAHEIEGTVKSVVVDDRKVVAVISGNIHLAMYAANRNDWEMPTSMLDDVIITYYRQPNDMDLEAQWQLNVAALRDSIGKTIKFSCPAPSYIFEQDRITSLSTQVLWLAKP